MHHRNRVTFADVDLFGEEEALLVVACFACGALPAHFVNPDAGWLCDDCDPDEESTDE